MPDVSVVPLEETTTQILELINLGVSSIIVFGVPSERDSVGSNASDQNGTDIQMIGRAADGDQRPGSFDRHLPVFAPSAFRRAHACRLLRRR